MGTTTFPVFEHLDTLTHTHVNNIQIALNNLEAAINITPGSSNAQVPTANIESLDASKLIGTSDASIHRLTLSNLLTVNGNSSLNGITTMGSTGSIKVIGDNDLEVLKIGYYSSDSYGLLATDGTNVNLRVDKAGAVSLRGSITALNGSEFTGAVNVMSGTVIGDLDIGGSDGVTLKGSTKEILVRALGKIKAGTNELTSTGITFNQGTIDIGTKFHVAADGKLTATDVDVTGRIVVTSGNFEVYAGIIGGATIANDSISVDGAGSETTGWSLDSSGNLYAKKANVTGTINATGGTLTGDLTMSGAGRLILPGVTFDSTGAHFSSLTLAIGSGKFNLVNGVLTATDVTLTGAFNVSSGNFAGNVTVGLSSNLKIDGAGQRIVAGTTLLTPSGITFKQGSIMLGTGTNGPGGDQNYRFYLSTDGHLIASDVDITGTFNGPLNSTSGKVASWLYDSTNLFAENTTDGISPETPGEINRSLFIMANGALTTYSDRAAIGVGHSDVQAVLINSNGLTVSNSKVSITTAISGSKKLLINNTGLRAQVNSTNEVVIDGDGLKCIKNSVDLGYIITPDGLSPTALADHSLTVVKFKNVSPKPVTSLTATPLLVQTSGEDLIELTITWIIPSQKTDNSTYSDAAAFRVFIKDTVADAGNPCLAYVDPLPDHPEIVDQGNPLYHLKTIIFPRMKPGRIYTIGIVAIDKLGNESTTASTTISTPVDETPPVPVLDNYFEVYSTVDTIYGRWTDANENDFFQYEVERCTSSDGMTYGDWEDYMVSRANMFIDRTAQPGMWYKYRVRILDRNNLPCQWCEKTEGIQLSKLELSSGEIYIDPALEYLGIYAATPVDATPYDATPSAKEPRGLAADRLYVGSDYSQWETVFDSTPYDATPLYLDDSPGNAYFQNDVYIGGTLTAQNVNGYQLKVSIQKEIELLTTNNGIAANSDHTIPNGKTYTVGSNDLLVFLDNLVLIQGIDYSEISSTKVRFLNDIPSGCRLTYLIFKI